MIGSSENRISYNGNGIATEFAYTFKILEKSDIKVLHVANDGTEELLTKDYYVDMEKSVVLYPGYAPGAEIPEQNRPPILPVGERLVIYREVPITQESALDKHWPFNVIEAGLDKLTIICQQLFDRLQRSFYVSESTSTNFDTKVPIEPGKTFRVKDDGTGFEVTEDPGKVIDGATALLKQTTEQAVSANEAATNAQNAATSAEKIASDLGLADEAVQTAVSSAEQASNSATTASTKADVATAKADVATTKASEASASADTATQKADAASTSATNAAQSYANADAVATQLTEYLATKETLTAPAVDKTLLIEGAAADSKVVGELKSDLANYIHNVNAQITDVTVRTQIAWASEISLPYLMFIDFNNNIYDKDIVIRFILADSTERYLNLRNFTKYDFGQSIIAYEIYVDANHISEPIDVNGAVYSGNGVFRELKKLNDRIDRINETNATLIEKINLSYKWKMFTFDTYRENLIVLGSNDGVNWETIGKDVFNGNEFGISLRDPSVIKINDTYYMIYSRITLRENNWEYPTGKYIGIAKSKDLLHWEGMNPIEFDGYHDMWAPEFYQKKDGSYGVILSCCQDGTDYHKIRTFDITNFEPFTYSSLSEPQTSNILGSVFDLNMKNIKNSYIVTLSASMRIRFGKEIDGVLTYYEGNASWYNNDIEGSFLIEMDGFYRMYVADHTVIPNTISYTDSKDLINWSDLKQCNLPFESLQHCSLIYEDEWINHKYNMLMN